MTVLRTCNQVLALDVCKNYDVRVYFFVCAVRTYVRVCTGVCHLIFSPFFFLFYIYYVKQQMNHLYYREI